MKTDGNNNAVSYPLLLTKLTVPDNRNGMVVRKRLADEIGNNLDRRLIILQADAGFGKTTLLTQVIKERRLPNVFYSLDQYDGSFPVFFRYLIAGLERQDPGCVEHCRHLASMGEDALGEYRLVMGTLINDLVERRKEELYFVFDDYHAIPEGSAVHSAMEYFIGHLPESVHVILASRRPVPFGSLPKWEADQSVFNVGKQGLKLDRVETAGILRASEIQFSQDDIKRLAQKTEGWVTGIQLVLNLMRQQGKSLAQVLDICLDKEYSFYEYFTGQVFNGETREIQRFLTQAAVLDEISVEACRKILNCAKSEEYLGYLARSSSFVEAAGKGKYRMHALFRDFLLKLAKNDGGLTDIHRKASQYYTEQGLYSCALNHALMAGDYDRVERNMVKMGMELKHVAESQALVRTIDGIGDPVVERRPALLFLKGVACFEADKYEEALGYFRVSYNLWSKGPKTEQKKTLCCIALLIQSDILKDRFDNENVVKCALTVLKLCPAKNLTLKSRAALRLGSTYMYMRKYAKHWHYFNMYKKMTKDLGGKNHLENENAIAATYATAGHIGKAYQTYRKAFDYYNDDYYVAVGIRYTVAAEVACAYGDTGWAESMLKRGWNTCNPYDDEKSQLFLAKGYGTLAFFNGEHDKAKEFYEKVMNESVKNEITSMSGIVGHMLCRNAVMAGDYHDLRKQIDRMRLLPESVLQRMHSLILQHEAALAIHEKRYDSAELLLKDAEKRDIRDGENIRLGTTYLYLANAYHQSNRGGKAQKSLIKAVTMSRKYGYHGNTRMEFARHGALREVASAAMKSLPGKSALRQYLSSLAVANDRSLATGTAKKITINLLGKFDIIHGQSDCQLDFKRRASQPIIAFFLLNRNRIITWQDVALWAWPEANKAGANHAFRNALSDIRKGLRELPPLIVHKNSSYLINPELDYECDVEVFENMHAQSVVATNEQVKLDLLHSAVSCYEGPLLPGHSYEWLEQQRTRLEEKYLKALLALANIYHAKGEFEKSIHYCLQYLGTNKLNEETYRTLISSYVKINDISAARKQYKEMKDILFTELRLSPSAKTVALGKCLTGLQGK